MSTVMVNFRAQRIFLRTIDDAARIAGMTRSDFIRGTLEDALSHFRTPTVLAPLRSPAKEVDMQPTARREDCVHPEEHRIKLPTGVKLCQACGAKLRP